MDNFIEVKAKKGNVVINKNAVAFFEEGNSKQSVIYFISPKADSLVPMVIEEPYESLRKKFLGDK